MQLITDELPSTMVTAHFCSVVYYNYGNCLFDFEQGAVLSRHTKRLFLFVADWPEIIQ